MKKVILLISMLLLSSSFLSAQIVVDGDNSDWADQPVLVSAPDNLEGYFPPVVQPIFTDRVDVKEVKAVIQNNFFYGLVTFQAGPVWPNYASDAPQHRGYYHLVFDLDNDPATGWDTEWYEGDRTTVWYYIDQGVLTGNAVGAELILAFGIDSEEGDSSLHKIKYISYEFADVSASGDSGSVDWETIVGIDAVDPDSAASFAWQGATRTWGWTEDQGDLRSHWFGHGWGEDFLELGGELTAVKEYFAEQGKSYLQEGQTITVAAFIETPIDGWGVDITEAGAYTVPAMTMRPSALNLDGDLSNWDAVPVLSESPDNLEGYFPPVVQPIYTDRVDAKTLKAKVENGAIYLSIEMQGGPIWPNFASDAPQHRGYYHFVFDLDNNGSTGWDTQWYEGDRTTLWYYIDQGVTSDYVGAEFLSEFGIKSESGPDAINQIVSMSYEFADVSASGDSGAVDWITIAGGDYTKPDSVASFGTDSYMLDWETESYMFWSGHVFSGNTLVFAGDWNVIVDYFSTTATPVGDQVKIAAFIETPIDGWGVDISYPGVLDVATAIEKDESVIVKNFELGNNYPNPFNPTTNIKFSIPVQSNVQLTIYNTLGQKIIMLVNEQISSGQYTATWNGTSAGGAKVSSGVYFYELKTDDFASVKKMLLVK